MSLPPDYPHRPKRGQRRDGLSTRSVVLDAAGKVFAARGFAEATSKEICELAGANSAAVNYYFGGKENLYEEVLVEAHRQMMSLEDLDDIINSNEPPPEKLRAFIRRIIKTAMSSSELWGIKIFLREFASPTPAVAKIVSTAVLPKAEKFRYLIHEITGLPLDSAQIQRAMGFVIMPCIGLLMFPEKLRSIILPATTVDYEDILESMLTYILGGLAALKDDSKN